ncbi:MAG: sugar-binding domain-containing protein [Bacteroidota bacterium]
MNNKTFLSVLFLLFLFSASSFPQVIIKELPQKQANNDDLMVSQSSSTRKATALDGVWNVYYPGNKDKKISVTVPSSFTGKDEIVMEKELKFSEQQLSSYNYQIYFLGVNYSSEISLNGYVIYKHPGGEFPFRVDLPRDLLKTKRKNILTVRLLHKYDSESTIPVKQRFLFGRENGGIFRNVYLLQLPKSFISNMEVSVGLSSQQRASLSVSAGIETRGTESRNDSSSSNGFRFRIKLISPEGSDVFSSGSPDFLLNSKRDKQFSQSFTVNNPVLWAPRFPQSYKLYIQLFRGETLIDEISQPVAFFSLNSNGGSKLTLNGEQFLLNGVTYMQSYYEYDNLLSYSRMRADIKLIKELGFNAVRFAKSVPHPFLLELCREYGLLAFVELPIGSIPSQIADKPSFIERSRSYLVQFLKNYSSSAAVAAIGLGSSYIPGDPAHMELLRKLAGYVKNNSNKMTFASFAGTAIKPVSDIDFYGVEIFNRPVQDYTDDYLRLESSLGRGRVFISEATYSTYTGSSNGYLNSFSYEAQAKFFSDLLDFTWSNKTSGYFINSMFDYRGAYTSLSAGYDSQNLYRIGILGEDRQINRLSYKVIYSKLHDGERVTIPIGSRKDDSPIAFILLGVVLALLMGLFINARKKFREDATRALLRPYNFFADIRDQRLLSGFHSNFLMVILSVCSALLQVNLLYYYRSNILFEKLLLSFGSTKLMHLISYLAWTPSQALLWLTLSSMVFFFNASFIVKIASLFIKNKVHFSSIYFAIVWAFLPLVLMLPMGLVLYKVLSADVLTYYILFALLIFTLWIFYRLMKGIYVILDVNPAPVYLYSVGFIMFCILVIMVYTQLSESTLYYISNAFEQYKMM